MLPIENKIVFTDGNYETPYVREVIEVLTEYQTELEEIRERIYDVEKGKSSKQDAVLFCEQMYGKGNIVTYTSGNNGVYDWQNGKRKGKTCRTVIRNYLNKQYRAGNDKQIQETEVDSNESAFSIAENTTETKYSLSDPNEHPVKQSGLTYGGHTGFRTYHIHLLKDDFDVVLLSNSGWGLGRNAIETAVYEAFYGFDITNREITPMDTGYI